MTVVREPAGLLDVAVFTVADARGALHFAARHGATWAHLEDLFAASPGVSFDVGASLFAKLRTAVSNLALVRAGAIAPETVIPAVWTPAELTNGTALVAAIGRCEQDIHKVLVELVPDKPTATAASDQVPDADSPFWSEA